MLSQEEMLRLIDRAMKGGIVDVDALGDAVLQPTKLTRFIRKMQESTVILPIARYFPMDAQIHDIDRISFTGRVLDSGEDAGGSHRNLDEADFAKPVTNTNVLTVHEFQAIVSLRDKALRRNIERENFEDTLIDLLGEAVGRDMEEFALFADKTFTYNQDHVLSKSNGWIKQAANAVYGAGGNKDFDPSADTYPENMLNAMLEGMPKEYLSNISSWRYWVNWTVENAYRDILKKRGTALGDLAYTTGGQLAYKGIIIERVPMIERAKTEGAGGPGDVAMLGYPNNHVWGVFHKVTIEREREAKKRRTDFVLTLEVDAGYEDENAVIVAYIDKENPVS
ncbi:MAG: phage major capsid protein [Proteobacteria bacterium]|nr:phage major capsid protein [Pseudomonadota bacterium]